MADIDLQRKERSWWPWILAGIVAVLAIWLIAEAFDTDAPVAGEFDIDQPTVVEPLGPEAGPAAEMGPAGEGAANAIAEFRQQCVEAASDNQTMDRQHQWTVTCLETMATAMDATIRADTVGSVVLQERLNTLRERATEVRESDPSATTHAGTVAEAFDAAAEVVETYQQERGATDAAYARGIRDAADRLTPEQPLLQQRDAVHQFFRQMGDALQSMTGA